MTFTPDARFTGTDTFTYTVTDANGAAIVATVTVHVGVPGPLAAEPGIAPIMGTDSVAIVPVPVGRAFGDPDQAGPLTLAVDPIALPPGLAFDPASGTFSGTPARDASIGSTPGQTAGTYIVPVTATDAYGAATTTFVTFVFANPPPAAVNDTVITAENTAITTGSVFAGNGGAADSDPDGDPIRVDGLVTGLAVPVQGVGIATPVQGSAGGTFIVQPGGAFTFDPGSDFENLAPGETRTTVVTYLLADDNGGSDTAALSVTVTGVNDAPTLIDPATGLPPVDPVTHLPLDPATANLIPSIAGVDGTAITPRVLGPYFGDIDASQGAPALSVDRAALPNGIVFNAATGTFSRTPVFNASQGGNVPGQPGVYRVPVTATDVAGATVTTYVTFILTNPPPIAAHDGPIETFENVMVTIPVLGNDRDPDGDAIRVVSAVSAQGTVAINADGTLAFTPAPGFAGTAVITYVITDDQGGTSTATVTIEVLPLGVAAIAPPHLADAPPPSPPLSLVESIDVTGAVVAAVNGQLDTGMFGAGGQIKIAGTLGDHAVSQAINGLQGLGGLLSPDPSLSLSGEPPFISAQGIVLQVSDRLNQLWWSDAQRIMQRDFDGNVEGHGGFSLRFGVKPDVAGPDGAPRFVIESLMRDGVLLLTFDEIGADRDGRHVVDYRVISADGRALPDWLERSSNSLVQGRRSANAETLDLRVTAILSDGTESTQSVRIQTRTGEIQPLDDRRSDLAPPLFRDQFRSLAHLTDRESTALAAMLAQ